jgi:hypothetical protein
LLRATARRFAAGGLRSADILSPLLLVASRRHAGGLVTRILDSFEAGSFISLGTRRFARRTSIRQIFGHPADRS